MKKEAAGNAAPMALPQKTASFGEWAERLEVMVESGELADEVSTWRDLAGAASAPEATSHSRRPPTLPEPEPDASCRAPYSQTELTKCSCSECVCVGRYGGRRFRARENGLGASGSLTASLPHSDKFDPVGNHLSQFISMIDH